MTFKPAYSAFLSARPGRLHFAAHSHHYWPDCTREAQLQYWDDSARLVDEKWSHIFGSVLAEAKTHLAEQLGLRDSSTLVTAENTHELVSRLLSCFSPEKGLRILTTDSEFHSFERQIRRYEELPEVRVDRVPVQPFATFDERLRKALQGAEVDLVFLSHVFFNSGYSLQSLQDIVKSVASARTLVVIDGYHAFGAIPLDLSQVQDRIFYLAGGYKYAQSGEGACFMHVPSSCTLRPLNTGWLADFSGLETGVGEEVPYASDANRFAGATFDPSGWYRFNAVMKWWKREGISVQTIHQHVRKLQKLFLENAESEGLTLFSREHLLTPIGQECYGHFLTYVSPNAGQIVSELKMSEVVLDSRGDRLRVGFGLYQEESDVLHLVKKLKGLGF